MLARELDYRSGLALAGNDAVEKEKSVTPCDAIKKLKTLPACLDEFYVTETLFELPCCYQADGVVAKDVVTEGDDARHTWICSSFVADIGQRLLADFSVLHSHLFEYLLQRLVVGVHGLDFLIDQLHFAG